MRGIVFLILFGISGLFAVESKEMIVYKSPYCGCCEDWIKIMKEKGFNVKAVNVQDVNIIKQKLGITPNNASCHTAIVDNYFIEGHVDYSAVKKMLAEKPNIKGLTVPGMPIGSPGMKQGNIKQPYDVLSIDYEGNTKVFESHR